MRARPGATPPGGESYECTLSSSIAPRTADRRGALPRPRRRPPGWTRLWRNRTRAGATDDLFRYVRCARASPGRALPRPGHGNGGGLAAETTPLQFFGRWPGGGLTPASHGRRVVRNTGRRFGIDARRRGRCKGQMVQSGEGFRLSGSCLSLSRPPPVGRLETFLGCGRTARRSDRLRAWRRADRWTASRSRRHRRRRCRMWEAFSARRPCAGRRRHPEGRWSASGAAFRRFRHRRTPRWSSAPSSAHWQRRGA